MTAISHPAMYQLGPLLRHYRHSRSAAVWLGIRIALISFGAFILFGVFAASPTGDIRFLAILGVVWVALSSIAIIHWRRKHLFDIAVFQDGLVYSQPQSTLVVRWQDIGSLYQQHIQSNLQGVPLGVYYNFMVQTITGESMKFTNAVENIEELGAHLQTVTFPHLFADALMSYKQGNIISFGKIGISSHGVHQGQKILAWSDVRDAEVVDGRLRIRKQGSWFAWTSIAIAKVPNIHVLLPLIEQQREANSKHSYEL